MNTRIFGGKPSREKTTAAVVSIFNIYYIKKTCYNHVLAQTHTITQAPTCRRLQPSLVYQPLLEGSYNPLLSFTSLSWKGATTPCSCLPASPGREIQPPDWRLQPSAPPWTTFHQFSYWIQQLPYKKTCRPLFIRFSDWTHSIHLSSSYIKMKLITP